MGEVEDNPDTLLPSSDLEFIDAFGTGYSHIAPGFDAKKVWGVDGDGDAFTRGIIAWLTEPKRFNSPMYLFGESYGTMRNAVVYRLLGEHGIGVTGVVEQSTILDYAPTLSGNDSPSPSASTALCTCLANPMAPCATPWCTACSASMALA